MNAPNAVRQVRFDLRVDEGASKLADLGEAIERFVKPGATVHVGYSDARPNAALQELARRFAGTNPQFTVVSAGLVNLQHALIELGLVRKLIVSFAGENYPVARPNPALVRAISEGRVEIEHWSLWALIARLTAGALGVSHFPVQSMRGSSMGDEAARRGELINVPGEQHNSTSLVSALRPDIVLLHAAAADEFGNIVLAAPYGEGQAGALAATGGVIATVEKLVSTEEIRRMNTLVRIPGHVVRAVCEAPFGAHPYGFNNPGIAGIDSYTEDAEFMAATLAASKTTATFRDYITEWILALPGHRDYLAHLGTNRVAALRRSTTPPKVADVPTDRPAGVLETQVVVTARRLEQAVRTRGHHAILAGVGLANLAAWLGARRLRDAGVDVDLMAEIGLFGYTPGPGEPFIFAGQNVPTNKMLTDVMSVLGTYVSGPATKSVGLVGAGQIDGTGAINSTYTDDGDFIVGSGGANDVLSGADEVIVTVSHQRDRLVDSVRYVTSPGARVRTIVTDLCVFQRVDGESSFVLTALLPASGDNVDEALAEVRRRTGFAYAVAPRPIVEPAPTPAELDVLRAFDPDQLFLRDRRPRATPTAAIP
ncbi:CoA-transferase [Mycobacterium sp. AZCC_0083]|uniref:CoA-transferase n=1 Tax=Mycobacterium sp. AZCC_0083 TaxID=2735882 RepID=UPI0017F9E638|nr:CoA-transferase [Mycobacterium sp. AZCC_0083]MBB5167846.1 acyl CoA:acetate/3-ketoacid CoA transferase alpha subunit/acyl CoA:acetate/3-ketoacid CoA transferase beta subunit [Mycobacterium sp. AZCC_0083]